ncbi:nuclear transport factor 2 family protein [Variovorax terrae]|uniref:Nuclear transport factor 2 family protein n=1 Tax=Variovorax terrae TaxID=2923278 RepID=A0A9X1VZA6_9BURK|nr:nuclear transport factor 2 family protein [Variovorax terrae]MCJ0764924.1 nuclear transport factor 2 family protein [Variovorax terrae]
MSGIDVFAIQRLISDFAWAADRCLAAELSELFLPDGTLTVNELKLHGRAEIEQDCRHRFASPQRKTRHALSNLRIDALGDGAYAGTAVQLTFESSGSDQPVRLRVSDVLDRFEQDPQGRWRFRSRTIERQMALLIPA